MKKIPYFYRKGQITSFKRLSNPKVITISRLKEKVQDNPLFEGYQVFVAGSLAVGYENPKDIDIIVTGPYDNYKVYEVLNELLRIGINELETFTDVFYIESIEVLDLPYFIPYNVFYDAYTPYNLEFEVVDNNVTMLRDFSKLDNEGLLVKHSLKYPSDKQLDRGYDGKKYIKIR